MTESNQKPVIEIPYMDIRQGSPVDLLKAHKEKTENMLAATQNILGRFSRALCHLLMPVSDRLSRRWLRKTESPYRAEAEEFEKIMGRKGVMSLNLSYEWGCTSGAVEKKGNMTLTRVLDWPFPGMGENIVVAHQQGPAGDFHNITWPGLSGVFNAVAKGRFAAAINQAPMRKHRLGIALNWLKNRHLVNRTRNLPPAHLLRHVFETASTYEQAKKMLTETPISLPVIYTLAGVKPGEGCVIERLENKAVVREMKDGKVFATNHFETDLKDDGRGWMQRSKHSKERLALAYEAISSETADGFSWFRAPIANTNSRLVMTGNAAEGTLQLMGTAGEKPVTKVFKL